MVTAKKNKNNKSNIENVVRKSVEIICWKGSQSAGTEIVI